jgi:hypothetical protein
MAKEQKNKKEVKKPKAQSGDTKKAKKEPKKYN